MEKKWKNKEGQGYIITCGPEFIIKVVTWYRHEFSEVTLIGRPRYKGHFNSLSNRLAYSQDEIERHIETCKDEIQNILMRSKYKLEKA